MPHNDGASSSSSGVGKVMSKSPPLPWPFGPHVAGYEYKITNKQNWWYLRRIWEEGDGGALV